MSTIATEAGHWYYPDGRPFYTIIGRNGVERPVTLRDARPVEAVPSVSMVIGCAAKPGLDIWKQDQVLLAALTLPRNVGESEDDWIARIRRDSREQSRKAADTGSALHGALERSMQGQPFDPAFSGHVAAVWSAIERGGLDLSRGEAERSFACALGYGGKCDWHLRTPDSPGVAGVVLDFKSKERIDANKRLAWDEHVMQLAAYARGFGFAMWPRAMNVFIGIKDVGVHIHEWTPDDMARGWQMYVHLLGYWQAKNKYWPRFLPNEATAKSQDLNDGPITISGDA